MNFGIEFNGETILCTALDVIDKKARASEVFATLPFEKKSVLEIVSKPISLEANNSVSSVYQDRFMLRVNSVKVPARTVLSDKYHLGLGKSISNIVNSET